MQLQIFIQANITKGKNPERPAKNDHIWLVIDL